MFPTFTPTPAPAEFELAIGDSLQFGDPSTGLQLEFRAVTGDSRCPKDVVCVWAGQAEVLLFVKVASDAGDEVIVTLNPGTPETIYVDAHIPPAYFGLTSRYAIELLRLLPDPPPVGGVDQQEYRLSLRISQQDSPQSVH